MAQTGARATGTGEQGATPSSPIGARPDFSTAAASPIAPLEAPAALLSPAERRRNPRETLFPVQRDPLGGRSGGRTSAWVAASIAILTLGSGLLNVYSVIGPGLSGRMEALRHHFPLEFIHFSRSAVLVIGYALILLSWNLLRRKRTAWLLAVAATAFSAVFHFTKGLDYEEASISAALLAALAFSRHRFTVRSRISGWREALQRLAIIAAAAFGYGAAGFWLLERREFRYDFAWQEAIRHAFTYLTLGTDPSVVPHTRYAVWFLDSLGLTSTVAVFYAGYLFFRPAYYAFRLHPLEMRTAKEIIQRHGRSGLDFFKAWPDKSFFFSESKESFLAYRVGAEFAVVLGDPVGPNGELGALIQDFSAFCHNNGWPFALHQATPDFLDLYESLGFRRFKIGDDAVVLLDQFRLEGNRAKALRSNVNKIEKAGYSLTVHEAPLNGELLNELEEVSDSWLSLPDHRERQFTLGKFDRVYLRETTVLAVHNDCGKVQAFLNLIPSCVPGEATLDLMRRRAGSINGAMDYLITKVLLHCRDRGYTRFALGMAPMAGFQPGESSNAEEKAIHHFFQKWNLGFRYQGIRDYKAKFATHWEPRYVIYRNRFDLARLVLALRKVSELPGSRPASAEER